MTPNRLKNVNGTVHYAGEAGNPACGPISTHNSWLAPTVADVTCLRCIARLGHHEPSGLTDTPYVDPHVARRAAERAARRAARQS